MSHWWSFEVKQRSNGEPVLRGRVDAAHLLENGEEALKRYHWEKIVTSLESLFMNLVMLLDFGTNTRDLIVTVI